MICSYIFVKGAKSGIRCTVKPHNNSIYCCNHANTKQRRLYELKLDDERIKFKQQLIKQCNLGLDFNSFHDEILYVAAKYLYTSDIQNLYLVNTTYRDLIKANHAYLYATCQHQHPHTPDDIPLVIENGEIQYSFWGKDGVIHRREHYPAIIIKTIIKTRLQTQTYFVYNNVLHNKNGPAYKTITTTGHCYNKQYYIYGIRLQIQDLLAFNKLVTKNVNIAHCKQIPLHLTKILRDNDSKIKSTIAQGSLTVWLQ
jgi:hypothetical protein